jgi:predicted ATPase/DNA-binding CsgD family transcriptional regulator
MSISLPAVRHLTALPTTRTPLLGRRREADELVGIVRRDGTRLVTVSGPGGVGKTRLALHIAEGLEGEWNGDRVFVPLASIRVPRLVLLAIGQAYGLLSDPDDDYEDGLLAALQGRRSLLVLDNLEQVLGVAPLLQRILDACSGITILATSQVPLGIPGEHVYSLAPFPTLDPASAAPEILMDQDACTLYVQRARAVDPGLPVTPEATLAIAEICHRLGGLPLAIELAAARSNVLSPQTVLERLDDHLRIFAQDRGDVPERQRTMRAAVAWSYNLLDPVEQAFFRWLCIFSGGFAADAASAMFTPGGGRTATDVLQELVSRSLVQYHPAENRYLMLEFLRSFGQEQLASLGEEFAARLVHAGWVTSFVEESESALRGADQLSWFRRIDAEMENVRAAVAWSLANGHCELAMRIAGAIWHYVTERGLVTEGQAWLAQALASTGPAVAPYRARALNAAGHLAHTRRDLDEAHRFFSQARTLAEVTGDRVQEVHAIYGLGHVAHIRNQFVDAFTLHMEGIALATEIGDQRLITLGESNLGLASFFQGKLEEAIRHWETAAEVMRPLGDLSGEALMLSNIGSATIRLGDLPKAREYLLQALDRQRMLGSRGRLLSTLNNLAIIHIQLKEHDLASELFGEALQMYREHGDMAGQAQIAHGFSNLELDKGDIRASAAWFVEAVQFLSATQDTSGIFDYTALLATICEEGGYLPEMVEVLAADTTLREALNFQTRPEDDEEIRQTLERAREAIGEQAYDAAWAAGAPLELPSLMRRMSIIARQIVGRRVESPPPLNPAAVSTTLQEDSGRSKGASGILTARELEVVQQLATGKSTSEIARELSVSARTVTTHIANILEKLDVSSRTAAVAHAMREGWV